MFVGMIRRSALPRFFVGAATSSSGIGRASGSSITASPVGNGISGRRFASTSATIASRIGVVAEEDLGVLLALAQPLVPVAEERPALRTISSSTASFSTSSSKSMPRSCIRSNSAVRNGGAILFLTTFTLRLGPDRRRRRP